MIKWSKVRFVRAGHGPDSPIMYVIIMNRTEHGNWKVETYPCDNTGSPVSDPVFLGYLFLLVCGKTLHGSAV